MRAVRGPASNLNTSAARASRSAGRRVEGQGVPRLPAPSAPCMLVSGSLGRNTPAAAHTLAARRGPSANLDWRGLSPRVRPRASPSPRTCRPRASVPVRRCPCAPPSRSRCRHRAPPPPLSPESTPRICRACVCGVTTCSSQRGFRPRPRGTPAVTSARQPESCHTVTPPHTAGVGAGSESACERDAGGVDSLDPELVENVELLPL